MLLKAPCRAGGATTSLDTLDAALKSFTQLGLRCHQAWLHSGAASHLTEFAGVEKECNCTMANHIYVYMLRWERATLTYFRQSTLHWSGFPIQ